VLTVRVEVIDASPELETEAGDSEQVGAKPGLGEMEQVSETEPLNPPIEVIVIVAEEGWPGPKEAGAAAEEVTEKSGALATCRKDEWLGRKLESPL
jgi:hypothetical protein